MRFQAPWLLLLAVPALGAVLVGVFLRRPPSAGFSALDAPHLLRPALRGRARALLPILRLFTILCVLVGLARPQQGTGRVETTVEAVAIQLLVDRSGSMREAMLLDGVMMRRLDAVKRVLKEFVLGNDDDLDGRQQDLIGLIAFGTVAETICPPVRDPAALAELTDTIEIPRIRSDQATAIGDAIALAVARLERVEQDLARRSQDGRKNDLTIKSKLVVLLSDGEQTEGEYAPLEAADLAAELGVKIYTIGVGRPDRHEATLREIASRTGGVFQRASDGNSLRKVYEQIDQLEKSSVTSLEYTDFDEQFMLFAMLALSSLLLEVLLASTLLRRVP